MKNKLTVKLSNFMIMGWGLLCGLLWALVALLTKGWPKEWGASVEYLPEIIQTEMHKSVNGFSYDVNNEAMPTAVFILLFAILFLVYLLVIKLIRKRDINKRGVFLILFFGILFRMMLLPTELIHENDIYRYLWDGRSAIARVNPYKYAPADVYMYENNLKNDFYDHVNETTIKAKEFKNEEILDLNRLVELKNQDTEFYERIGHWQVPTIYPPVAQIVFAFAAVLKANSILTLKILFFFFELGILWLIIRLLQHFSIPSAHVVIYAWNPLVLKEFANSGHYDPVVIFFTLATLLFFLRQKFIKGLGALAFSILSKFFTIILFPILYRRQSMMYFMLLMMFLTIVYVPFFQWDKAGFLGVFKGLYTYNEQWSYNSSIFAVIFMFLKTFIPNLAESLWPAKFIVGTLFLIFLGYLRIKEPDDDITLLKYCFYIIAALFILNPVGDPWYFCWIIPFLCFFPFRSWIILSGLLILSYFNFQSFHWVEMKFWNIPLISWIIYVPFFILWIYEMLTKQYLNKNILNEKTIQKLKDEQESEGLYEN